MRALNLIAVFSQDGERLLLCERKKPPFAGKLNLVGGKVEPGEESDRAAYRELFEETGIDGCRIELCRVMDLTYYREGYRLEVYAGRLFGDTAVRDEVNALRWVPLKEDLSDLGRFAGDGNLWHIVLFCRKALGLG